jgi:prepilin-type processing-associated H-X9-DG protein
VGLRFTTEQAPAGATEKPRRAKHFFRPVRGFDSFNDYSHGCTVGYYLSPLRGWGKANAVFCDGHVESPPLPFLFADTSDAALSRWNRDHQPHRERLSP